MDITTLVEWERALRQTEKNAAPAFSGTSAINVPPTNFIPAAIERPVSKPVTRRVEIPADVPAAQESEALYRMNTASALRRQPHFSAPVITRLTIGAKVSVLNRRGDWLEIGTGDAGLAGFVRKEFVTRSEPMRKQ
jgi:hypothetical protein